MHFVTYSDLSNIFMAISKQAFKAISFNLLQLQVLIKLRKRNTSLFEIWAFNFKYGHFLTFHYDMGNYENKKNKKTVKRGFAFKRRLLWWFGYPVVGQLSGVWALRLTGSCQELLEIGPEFGQNDKGC